jgi:murein L,D-transpeptidase YafK
MRDGVRRVKRKGTTANGMNDPEFPKRAGFAWRSIGRMLAVLVAALATAVAAWLLADRMIHGDWEHVRLERERALRAAQNATGLVLPGTPDLARLDQRLAASGLAIGAPIFMRIFKREFELELWMKQAGAFVHFATYPICRWSGRIGPKLKEGDAQAPEGFYTVDASALNPQSRWHRSFNLGYPNALDRAHGRTGSFLMVHGGCGSIGCYAMTDPVIDEIWRIATAALGNGQPRFHVHVFPFRMTDDNLAGEADSLWSPFWQDLKAGHDMFETSRTPPKIHVCQGRYVATAGDASGNGSQPLAAACPKIASRPRRRPNSPAARKSRVHRCLRVNPIQHLGSPIGVAMVRSRTDLRTRRRAQRTHA